MIGMDLLVVLVVPGEMALPVIPAIDLPEISVVTKMMIVQTGDEKMVPEIEEVRAEIKTMVAGDEMTVMEMLKDERGRKDLLIRNRSLSQILSQRRRWERTVGRI